MIFKIPSLLENPECDLIAVTELPEYFEGVESQKLRL